MEDTENLSTGTRTFLTTVDDSAQDDNENDEGSKCDMECSTYFSGTKDNRETEVDQKKNDFMRI